MVALLKYRLMKADDTPIGIQINEEENILTGLQFKEVVDTSD